MLLVFNDEYWRSNIELIGHHNPNIGHSMAAHTLFVSSPPFAGTEIFREIARGTWCATDTDKLCRAADGRNFICWMYSIICVKSSKSNSGFVFQDLVSHLPISMRFISDLFADCSALRPLPHTSFRQGSLFNGSTLFARWQQDFCFQPDHEPMIPFFRTRFFKELPFRIVTLNSSFVFWLRPWSSPCLWKKPPVSREIWIGKFLRRSNCSESLDPLDLRLEKV